MVNPLFADGTRVRVQIENHDRYAFGCAKCLDGQVGAIERTQLTSYNGDPSPGPAQLVTFDAPAPTWWSGQDPEGCKAFWFPPQDLRAL